MAALTKILFRNELIEVTSLPIWGSVSEDESWKASITEYDCNVCHSDYSCPIVVHYLRSV